MGYLSWYNGIQKLRYNYHLRYLHEHDNPRGWFKKLIFDMAVGAIPRNENYDIYYRQHNLDLIRERNTRVKLSELYYAHEMLTDRLHFV